MKISTVRLILAVVSCGFVFGPFLGGPTYASQATLNDQGALQSDGATAAMSKADAIALLGQAVAKAEADAADRYAFTMAYQISTDEAETDRKEYVLRFDPRLAKGEQWELKSPDISELSKKERKLLRGLQQDENTPDGVLIYDQLALDEDTIEITGQTEETVVIEGRSIDTEVPERVREAVILAITLNKAGAFIEKIQVQADKPFKPVRIAKVNEMNQVQTFAAPTDGLPAILEASESVTRGEAMFKDFYRGSSTSYSDIVRVPADDITP
ncbi:MAG: hypothetical protein AAFR21_04380 [Pseudomonadota bacterium]